MGELRWLVVGYAVHGWCQRVVSESGRLHPNTLIRSDQLIVVSLCDCCSQHHRLLLANGIELVNGSTRTSMLRCLLRAFCTHLPRTRSTLERGSRKPCALFPLTHAISHMAFLLSYHLARVFSSDEPSNTKPASKLELLYHLRAYAGYDAHKRASVTQCAQQAQAVQPRAPT